MQTSSITLTHTWWGRIILVLLVLTFGLLALGGTLQLRDSLFPPPPPPEPITFPDLPNPIEAPGEPNVELPRDARPKFHAGEGIITLPLRCVTDDAHTGLGELGYTFTRALYDADTHQKVLDMPGGSNSAAVGCYRSRSNIQYIPDKATPGVYYLGGTVTAVGAKRSGTVLWRTADFEVIP